MDNDLLYGTNILKNSIHKIIDVFCMYYGEDKREIIENKFNSLLIMGYVNPSSIFVKKNFREYYNKSLELENILEKKYRKIYVKELKKIFSGNKNIPKILKKKFNLYLLGFNYDICNILGIFMSVFADKEPYIGGFSSDGCLYGIGEIVNKSNRENYFKELKIEESSDMIPDINVVNEFISLRNKIRNDMINEFYSYNYFYNYYIDMVNKLNLCEEVNKNVVDILFTGINCIMGIKKDYGYSYSLFINLGDFYNIDFTIIHEMNHMYEMNSSNYSGWDIRNSNTNYTLFNEMINDFISSEILELLNKNDSYIFPNDKKKKVISPYSYYNVLVNEFYEKYKEVIIESRSNGNIQIIYDRIGKDNFNRLNDLINKTKELGIDFHNYNSFIRGDKPEFRDILEERDRILSDMEEYFKSRKM